MTEDEVEAVARALYESLENARGWGREPELLKQKFRRHARIAIATIDQREALTSPAIKPLRLSGPLEAFLGYLMVVPEISILPASSFRAVLRGPEHIFDAANDEYFKVVGHRELFDVPVRDAFPDLAGQGYFELLDRVYATKQTFIGEVMPVRFQLKPGGALEERRVDLVYRPIEGPNGETLGLFVEGCDRTVWGRA
ncbi:hypothetical protein [Microvirga sp. P5_D2]